MKKSCLLLVAGMLLSFGLQAKDEKVKFTFHRYFLKGNSVYVNLKYDIKETRLSYLNNEVINKEETSAIVHYGVQTIINAVNDRGLSTDEVHVIYKAQQIKNGELSEILPKDSSLKVQNIKNKKEIRLNGKLINSVLAKQIEGLVELNLGGPTYDDMFHDGDLHKSGDTWKINTGVISNSFQTNGVNVAKETIEGKSNIQLVGKECVLNGFFRIRDFPYFKENHPESDYQYNLVSKVKILESFMPYETIKTTTQKMVQEKEGMKSALIITKIVTTQYFLKEDEFLNEIKK